VGAVPGNLRDELVQMRLAAALLACQVRQACDTPLSGPQLVRSSTAMRSG
jgi:hypothetical protein